jgi:DNA-directed RNA polymerase specialized sigma24 family protein
MLQGGTVTSYKLEGWKRRAATTYDARKVRVADFELAFQTLPARDQTVLILTQANGFSWNETGAMIGVSPHAVGSLVAYALDALAIALDRRSLLARVSGLLSRARSLSAS